MTPVTVTLALRNARNLGGQIDLKSEANIQRGSHWNSAKRKDEQRQVVGWALRATGRLMLRAPFVVVFTRRAVRLFDVDGLASSMKRIQDTTAEWLGVDDGDRARVTWHYNQIKVPSFDQETLTIVVRERLPEDDLYDTARDAMLRAGVRYDR